MKKLAIYFMLGTLLLLTACGSVAITAQTPPTIVYGEDVCDHCGMIINDERFAAGLVIQTASQTYEHRIFDDIGDMFVYVEEAQETTQHADETIEVVTYFVHDYVDGTWLDAQDAYFVQAETLNTPMGSGLAAFASQTAAEAQAQEWQTTVLDFDRARDHATLAHGHEHSSH